MTVFFHQFQLLEFDGFGNLFGGTLGDDEGLVNLFGSKEYKSMLKVIRKGSKMDTCIQLTRR